MADNTMTETDGDEEELVPVETPPEKADDSPDDSADEEDDSPTEDARLGDSEEEPETSANSKRRKQRREYARQKRDEARQELEYLRSQNAELVRRVGAVEAHTVSSNETAIVARLQQAQSDVQQAEEIFAKATSEGQGDYALQAIRIRDAARAEAERLTALAQETRSRREQIEQQTQAAPRQAEIQRHKGDWVRDNPWFDPNGADEVSKITLQIDNEVAQAGYDPTKRVYWEEVTRRVSAALSGSQAPAEKGTSTRNAPPMGTSREHAPPSTRRSEIYVTPARKQAMIEAGIWDDPVRRQRLLKEYRDYDKASAR